MNSQNENILTVLKKESNGIKIIRNIKRIIITVQKLRGYVNISLLLHLDNNYTEKIKEEISLLSKEFDLLDFIIKDDISLAGVRKDLKNFNDALESLNLKVSGKGINYFNDYSKCIRVGINLIIDIADRSFLLAERDEIQAIILNIIINISLNMMENISKIRASGMSLINKKLKNANDESELKHYIGIIKNDLNLFQDKSNIYIAFIDSEKERVACYKTMHYLNKNIKDFLDLTEKELLNQDIIFIEPIYFFEQGELIFKFETSFYNKMFNTLENRINTRIAVISRNLLKEKIVKYSIVLLISSFILYTSQVLI